MREQKKRSPGPKRLDRVVLPAKPEEGWPEESGHVVEVEDDGTYVVQADGPLEPGDDGLREVRFDGARLVR